MSKIVVGCVGCPTALETHMHAGTHAHTSKQKTEHVQTQHCFSTPARVNAAPAYAAIIAFTVPGAKSRSPFIANQKPNSFGALTKIKKAACHPT